MDGPSEVDSILIAIDFRENIFLAGVPILIGFMNWRTHKVPRVLETLMVFTFYWLFLFFQAKGFTTNHQIVIVVIKIYVFFMVLRSWFLWCFCSGKFSCNNKFMNNWCEKWIESDRCCSTSIKHANALVCCWPKTSDILLWLTWETVAWVTSLL